MLIGQFCESYPPTIDGVGRVMLSYCQQLSALGHRTLYIAPENPGQAKPDNCETLLYRGVHVPGEVYRAGIPAWDGAYRRTVHAMKFDILHTHSPFFVGAEARRLARRDRIPLVATFHSKYYDDFLKATHSKHIARAVVAYIARFYETCDEVWAVNEQTGDVLKSYGYRGSPVVMPNGTDLFTVTPEGKRAAFLQYQIPEGVPVLIFAGQQNLKKNPDSVLRACALLKAQGQKTFLIMVGTGPDLGKIKALARELSLERDVLFTGFLSERELLMALYERADLMVFPSLYDNAPMVVREAAAMGTPALLIEGSCSAEGIVHGENGYLCVNTPEAIAAGIAQALPTAQAVGLQARETIPIPWDRLMLTVEARYRTLIENKQRGTLHET